MITDPDGPADTRIMGIVHSALRRDLLRIEVATATKTWQETHRMALADHVLWMMDFLHHHHESEDKGLYPLVLRCNSEAGPLVDRMNTDHRTIEPAISAVEAAALDLRSDRPGSGEALGAALVPAVRGSAPPPRTRGTGDDAAGLEEHHRCAVAGVGRRVRSAVEGFRSRIHSFATDSESGVRREARIRRDPPVAGSTDTRRIHLDPQWPVRATCRAGGLRVAQGPTECATALPCDPHDHPVHVLRFGPVGSERQSLSRR